MINRINKTSSNFTENEIIFFNNYILAPEIRAKIENSQNVDFNNINSSMQNITQVRNIKSQILQNVDEKIANWILSNSDGIVHTLLI